MDVEEKLKSLVQTIVIVSIVHEKKNWKNIRNTMRNVNLTTFYNPHNSLIYKAFWHIFTKNSFFLNVDIVKYSQKNMIQKRLSWKQQTDNLCMSAMLLF